MAGPGGGGCGVRRHPLVGHPVGIRRRHLADRDRAGAARLPTAARGPDPSRGPRGALRGPHLRPGRAAHPRGGCQVGTPSVVSVGAGGDGPAGPAPRHAPRPRPVRPRARRASGRRRASRPAARIGALSARTLGAVVFVAALIALTTVSRTAAAALAGSLFIYLVGIGQGIWRRFNDQYRFTVAVAPDGIRVRRGLLSTVSETIPIRRVQAVRQIEPLLWRMFGWCRLEVDLAGVPGHGRSRRHGTDHQGPAPGGLARHGGLSAPRRDRPRRAAPVPPLAPGSPEGAVELPLPRRRPRRHLGRGGDGPGAEGHLLGATRKGAEHPPRPGTGAAGPGARHGARRRARPAGGGEVPGPAVDEADRLVEELASRSRGAREHVSVASALGAAVTSTGPPPTFATPGHGDGTPPPTTAPAPPTMGPGWFADPSRRHQARYWNGMAWSESVSDDGVTGVDPL